MFRAFLARWGQSPSHGRPDDAEALPPRWATDLAEHVHKMARSQAKGQVQAEGLERKVEAGFGDLRHAIDQLARAASGPADLDWTPLLDALDSLAEAEALATRCSDQLDSGLRAISGKLAAFAGQAALVRLGASGVPPDGRYFRVVGTQERLDVPPGQIVRIVRAAVVQGDRLVREGQCVVSAPPLSAPTPAASPEADW